MNLPSFSRRRFLQSAAAAVVVSPWLSSSSRGAVSPNGKLNHACIGVGGMGWGDLQNFLQHPKAQVVALCDVDAQNLKKAAEAVPQARLYADWRELLEKETDRIDSANVTVPDHMHFPIAYQAIQKGKHVYCQKPLCHDVGEVRALAQAAIQKNVITQLGTQMASGVGDRTAVQLLRAGAVGKIKHIFLCANRPGAVENYRLKGPRPSQATQPPDFLQWDLWLGTAPVRPYAPEIYHPVKWRAWLDFGTGWSGDIGCHIFDAVWKGLNLKAPKSVTAKVQQSWQESSERRADTWPQANHITWIFPGNELTADSELIIEWFDGEFYPPREIRALYSVDDYPTESAMLIGTDGAMLIPSGTVPFLLPEDKFKTLPRPKFGNRNHYHHFIDACLGGEKTESHFAQTGPMTEAILLGTVALRHPSQKLEWDAVRMKFPNYPTAENLLRRHYRTGWTVS
ncbi:MAG TPA: Gfo/Idh/MocA family oxidoreductase [Candidatus Paceibacterota bacterium]|nr:Gfo/Idh/MocA family oxidoreductase [Verrucomicrobiota bacterium]HRY50649.1 Gfo/Idh/MocA family oxidoreductase [Candidatus Paceibacterota bacterium]HSA03477.1 Gfo/Idh/MocA family oxidoreductase [Candidatus Paceibacterota bacterium]